MDTKDLSLTILKQQTQNNIKLNDKSQLVFDDLKKIYSNTLKECKNSDSIDILAIITRAMMVAAQFSDLSGTGKKDIVVQAIVLLLHMYLPQDIIDNPLFEKLIISTLESTIDKLYWAALQGASFFNKKGCGCC